VKSHPAVVGAYAYGQLLLPITDLPILFLYRESKKPFSCQGDSTGDAIVKVGA